jgi:hypothetical protein
MLQPRLLALPIPRQTRRGDIELRRDAVANLDRNVEPVRARSWVAEVRRGTLFSTVLIG